MSDDNIPSPEAEPASPPPQLKSSKKKKNKAKRRAAMSTDANNNNIIDPKSMPDIQYDPIDPLEIVNKDEIKAACALGFGFITVKAANAMLEDKRMGFGGE